MTSDPHIVGPGDAPTPFTAAEIELGCPPGRTVTSRTISGGSETVATTVFGQHTADGATMTVGDQSFEVRWTDLQAHASFPESATEISEEIVDTPLGRLICLRYTVKRDDDTAEFWFDRDRPGMPVRHVVSRGGQTTYYSEMIEDRLV